MYSDPPFIPFSSPFGERRINKLRTLTPPVDFESRPAHDQSVSEPPPWGHKHQRREREPKSVDANDLVEGRLPELR